MPTLDFAIPTAWGALNARLYDPVQEGSPGAGLVFFHGGGFVVCDIETHDDLCRRLALSSRIRVVSVDYRLAPEAPFPAQLEDGEDAIRWVHLHGSSLGIDPARLLAGGDSAGGYVALAAAAKINAETPATVAGLLLIYPLLELAREAWASTVTDYSRSVGRVAVDYIRRQLRLDSPPASLAQADLRPVPPTLVVVGGALDPCRSDALRLASRLRQASRLVQLLEYPRLPHGFASLAPVSRASRTAVDQIGEELGRLARLCRSPDEP